MSFQNKGDRTLFSKQYTPNIEVKHFNVLIDGKGFLDTPIKNKEQAYEKIIEIGKTMTIQLVIYWIMISFQSIIN